MVGQSNYFGVQVISVQQRNNGSDCEAFAAPSGTCLAHVIQPQAAKFDIPQMGPHLLKYLKSGMMKLFPTC